MNNSLNRYILEIAVLFQEDTVLGVEAVEIWI